MNKIAFITGSSRGIGKSIAETLAKDGFDIIIHCNKAIDKANHVAENIKKLGRETLVVQGDLTIEKDVEEIFKQISTFTQKIDVLVNNAGADLGYMIEDYTLDQMKYVVDIVLISKFAVTKYALPFLKKSDNPKIINIASRMGREKTIEGVGAYGPAEAGVIKFTQCCALEFAKYNIKVNCIAPGLTYTDLSNDIFIRDEGSVEKANELWKILAEANPSKRVGQPQDIANLVSFLASDKADYINGEYLGVNGGSNLG